MNTKPKIIYVGHNSKTNVCCVSDEKLNPEEYDDRRELVIKADYDALNKKFLSLVFSLARVNQELAKSVERIQADKSISNIAATLVGNVITKIVENNASMLEAATGISAD